MKAPPTVPASHAVCCWWRASSQASSSSSGRQRRRGRRDRARRGRLAGGERERFLDAVMVRLGERSLLDYVPL